MTDQSINERVARNVMGWVRHIDGKSPIPSHDCTVFGFDGKQWLRAPVCKGTRYMWAPFDFEHNIADAMLVVERIWELSEQHNQPGFSFALTADDELDGYACYFLASEGIAETAPRAICLAALEAVKEI